MEYRNKLMESKLEGLMDRYTDGIRVAVKNAKQNWKEEKKAVEITRYKN